jgi:glycosyltransferase involved in cell wall biosynthesis
MTTSKSTISSDGLKHEPDFPPGNEGRVRSPWVLIAGDFRKTGGMDKANLALAEFLVEQGGCVHLVCHSVDTDFAKNPLVTVHPVPRPAGSHLLGRPLLDLLGRRVARKVTETWPNAPVVVNGENCLWPGINWVHYVHHAWDPNQTDGPLWLRIKERLNNWHIRRRERSAARISRIFITNSNRTSRDLIERLGVDPPRVHTVYLGAESEWGLVTRQERLASKKSFEVPQDRPIGVFVGALGFDHRKGLDILLESWQRLCADPHWDVDLWVAGSGNALDMWRAKVSQLGLGSRIRLLGFVKRMPELLAAADLLVSPVRYEAYGLNVQEAICRGIPAIVSASAGIAERYGDELAPLLLPDPEDVADLVQRLQSWRLNMQKWEVEFQRFGASLREHSWREMARRIVSIADQQTHSEVEPSQLGQVIRPRS